MESKEFLAHFIDTAQIMRNKERIFTLTCLEEVYTQAMCWYDYYFSKSCSKSGEEGTTSSDGTPSFNVNRNQAGHIS